MCPVENTVSCVVGLGEDGEILVVSSTVVGIVGVVTFRTEVILPADVTFCTGVTNVAPVAVVLIVVYLQLED